MDKLSRRDGASADLVAGTIDKLKGIVPEAFADGRIDFDVLKQTLGEYVDDQDERYSFTWHGKSRARRIAQTSSTGTLLPCPEESVNWDTTKNILIEGDNLEVLKLLQKSYHRKVKMIYIDPPYNTGKEFIYPDKWQDNLDTYLQYTGQIDKQGFKLSANAETSGRYHTNWLNMMYPRLKLARNLLRDDGVIAISIDDVEMANLFKLCAEIFGEENHIATIVWQKRYVSNVTAKWMSDMHDFVLLFARNREAVSIKSWNRTEQQLKAYKNPDQDPRGRWRAQDLSASRPYNAGQFTITGPTGRRFKPPPNRYWRCNQKQFDKWEADRRIWWGVNRDARPMLKSFLSESERGITPHTWWDYGFAGHNKEATLELKALFDGDAPFDTPKPVKLMRRLVELVCTDGDLALDFFAGSAPLAQAILELSVAEQKRIRFILVQLPEPAERPGFDTIADIGKERIRRVIQAIKNSGDKPVPIEFEHNSESHRDLGFRAFTLSDSNIKRWNAEFDSMDNDLVAAIDNIRADRSEEDVLYELLLKFGLDLATMSEARDIEGRKVTVIGAGALVVCLADDITLEVVSGISALKDELKPEVMRVVFKDSGFPDDVAKTNAAQILRQAGIDDVKSL